MTRYVLHYTAGDHASADPPAWQKAVEDDGFVLLRASEKTQALAYARSYEIVGLLIEMSAQSGDGAELAAQFANSTASSPPVIGILEDQPAGDVLERLGQAGFKGFITPETPAAFLLHWLQTCRALLELKSFEQSGMDVKALAGETRKIVHDLSQPLAVLQGRLQLLASKTPDDNPEKEKIKTMLTMVVESTKHLRELQELHRKYS